MGEEEIARRALALALCNLRTRPGAALAVKGVTGIRITAERGQIVAPPPEGTGYLGFIFARGRAVARVEASLRHALKRLDFKLRPEVSLHAARHG